jgi:hypothetical protein
MMDAPRRKAPSVSGYLLLSLMVLCESIHRGAFRDSIDGDNNRIRYNGGVNGSCRVKIGLALAGDQDSKQLYPARARCSSKLVRCTGGEIGRKLRVFASEQPQRPNQMAAKTRDNLGRKSQSGPTTATIRLSRCHSYLLFQFRADFDVQVALAHRPVQLQAAGPHSDQSQ